MVFRLDNLDFLFRPYPRCTIVRWWKRDGTMVKARWYDGENAMVRWWKRDGAIVRTRWHDGEQAIVRWWKHDGAMGRWWKRDGTITLRFHHCAIAPSRFHHRVIAFSSSYHRVFTIVPSHFHHRTIVHRGYRLNKNHDCPNGSPHQGTKRIAVRYSFKRGEIMRYGRLMTDLFV
jgi:hypothetical protein